MGFFRNGRYRKVEDEKSDTDSIGQSPQFIENFENEHQFGLMRNIIICMFASSIGLALILGISFYSLIRTNSSHTHISLSHTSTDHFSEHHTSTGQKQTPSRVCGNSSSEALALGCTFDSMSWSWLSPTCPRYASAEFAAADEWKYYIEPHDRIIASSENWTQALDNQVSLFGERREHMTHCIYTFLSLAQVVRDGTQTHPTLSSYGHIQHCAKVVLESLKRDKDWYTVDTDMGKVSFDEGC